MRDPAKGDGLFLASILAIDPDDCAITAATIDLARNMGITSIAEGVETQAQLEFLRERGCEEMQGFITSAPMPVAETAAWLAAYRDNRTVTALSP